MTDTLESGLEAPSQLKQSYWRIVWRQLRRNRLAMCALVFIGLLMLVALGAPFLAGDVPILMSKDGDLYIFPNIFTYKTLTANNLYNNFDRWTPGEGEWAIRPPVPYSRFTHNFAEELTAPNIETRHYLGTDDRGRDVLSRLIWGTRISMSVGFVAVGFSVVIGIVIGALGGYYGGWVDMIVQRVIEVMMCFPTFFIIITLIAGMPKAWRTGTVDIFAIMVVLGVTGWTGIARLVRGEFLKLRESDFITAARATGLHDLRVVFRHALPNALGPVLVSATFGVAGAILTESGLSFLGFGVQPPTPSWGEMLKQAQANVTYAWWLVMFPGVAVFLTVTAFNLVGEGIRDAMDPRLRQ